MRRINIEKVKLCKRERKHFHIICRYIERIICLYICNINYTYVYINIGKIYTYMQLYVGKNVRLDSRSKFISSTLKYLRFFSSIGLHIYSRFTRIHTRILFDIISILGCRQTVWKMIDLFMVRVRCGNVSYLVRANVGGFSILLPIIPGIIRQMPVTVKEKEGRADRQSRLLASTADTWSTRSPKVSSTLTDLSIGSSRTAFSFSSSEIFGFLWNPLEVHTVDRTFLSRP